MDDVDAGQHGDNGLGNTGSRGRVPFGAERCYAGRQLGREACTGHGRCRMLLVARMRAPAATTTTMEDNEDDECNYNEARGSDRNNNGGTAGNGSGDTRHRAARRRRFRPLRLSRVSDAAAATIAGCVAGSDDGSTMVRMAGADERRSGGRSQLAAASS